MNALIQAPETKKKKSKFNSESILDGQKEKEGIKFLAKCLGTDSVVCKDPVFLI